MRTIAIVAAAALLLGAGAASAQAINTADLVLNQDLAFSLNQTATSVADASITVDAGSALDSIATNALLVAGSTVDIANTSPGAGTTTSATATLTQDIGAAQTQIADASSTTATLTGIDTTFKASALNVGAQATSTITVGNSVTTTPSGI